jgi:hypothetical protein
MTWLLWRQHRLQLLITAVCLAVFAGPVWITGRHLAATLRDCRSAGSCANVNFFSGYNVVADIVALTVAVPVLLGVFWGATIVGKELETGTATLVWSQSTTRRHWVRTKVLSLLVTTTAAAAALAALVTWWSDTRNSVLESRFTGLQFDIQGVVPVAYALFAVSLGLATGVLWRRVLPAMATTLGGFIAVRLAVELGLRPHYLAPVRRVTGLVGPDTTPSGSWNMGSDVLVNGHVVGGAVRPPAACAQAATRDQMSSCLGRFHYQLRTTYQPAGRYWTFQWIEFGIFAVLAAVLVVTALVVLRRRDA